MTTLSLDALWVLCLWNKDMTTLLSNTLSHKKKIKASNDCSNIIYSLELFKILISNDYPILDTHWYYSIKDMNLK